MTSPTPDDARPDGQDRVAAAVARWRAELTAVGGPNRLLWFRETAPGTLALTNAHPAGVAKLLAGRSLALSEIVRSPEAFAEACHRARVIRRTARRLEEQRGLRTCFLAVGTATWTVPDTYPDPPAAPVLLRSLVLRPSDITESDFELDLAPGFAANPVLLDYLRTRGLELDPDALVHAARNGSPEGTYTLLRESCARLPGFQVRPSLVISTFSTAKSVAINDLADPADLAAHPVIAALAGEPEALDAVAAVAPSPPDEPDLGTERIVLDADAAQHAVVDAVAAGSHLVVNGPPGTGKSQTAANLVATLTAQGRRVLLVSEKRAALETVKRRLGDVQLGDLILDPWDPGALTALQRTLREATMREHSSGSSDFAAPALVSARGRLADHRRSIHEPREPWGVSVDEAQTRISELAALSHPPHSRIRLVGTHLHRIPAERLDEVRQRLVAVAEAGAWSTEAAPDPWYGARIVGDDQTRRVRELVRRLADGGLDEYRTRVGDLAERVSLKRPRTVLQADEQLDLMGKVFATLEIFRPAVFETPLDQLVAATARRGDQTGGIGLLERRRLRAQARDLLRPGPPPHDLHGVLVRAADQKQQWRERSGPGSSPSAPADVPDVEREHRDFREELEWLAARLEPTAEGGDLINTDLDALQDRLERLAAAGDRLSAVPRTISQTDALRREHLGPLLDDFAAHRLPAERVPDELDFVWWSSVLDEIKSRDPSYAAHDGEGLRRVLGSYERADRKHLAAAAERVADEVAALVRQAVTDFPEQAQLLLDVPTDRPSAWHALLAQAPELLTVARPCWVMSPHEVAGLVPPGLWFDVVVFDEASQLSTASAISAISRAEQVVVLGDPQQLPPTPFAVSGERSGHGAGESLLDTLLPILPQQTLTWHYRSEDERLIAVANAQSYQGTLVTLPSPAPESPVRLELVEGARSDGRTSRAEVVRVVALVRAQLSERPTESVAVVGFSEEHVVAVEEALHRAAEGDETLAAALGRESEPLAVWTPDAAQGRERDAVVVTVGCGRDATGAVTYRFGSIGEVGGERGLTVALTRARRRLTVVSSVGAQDLVPAKLRSRGGQLLRDLLVYAAGEQPEVPQAKEGVSRIGGRRRRTASTGSVLDRPVHRGSGRPAAPVVADLTRRLRSKGLVVHESFGRSALPIDVVVADAARPDEPLVAVETDGPTLGVTGVRDRDRLRPELLRARGWAYERVWTVDVFRDPARDVARIQSLVERLSRERGEREHPERGGEPLS